MVIRIENRHSINDAMRNARGTFAVIGISDPYDDPHVYSVPLEEPVPGGLGVQANGFAGMLRLHFYDCGPETNHDHRLIFNKSHLAKIVAFVSIIAGDCALLIIHCDRGISRSSALAMGISGKIGASVENMSGAAQPNSYILNFINIKWDDVAFSIKKLNTWLKI